MRGQRRVGDQLSCGRLFPSARLSGAGVNFLRLIPQPNSRAFKLQVSDERVGDGGRQLREAGLSNNLPAKLPDCAVTAQLREKEPVQRDLPPALPPPDETGDERGDKEQRERREVVEWISVGWGEEMKSPGAEAGEKDADGEDEDTN